MIPPSLQAAIDRIFGPLLNMQLSQDGNPYDELMAQINPELLSTNISALKAMYQFETPAQKQSRAARYTKDFAEYDRRFGAQTAQWKAQVQNYRHMALATTEQIDRDEEQEELQSLTDDIDNA